MLSALTIIIIKKMFLGPQISILERFLKDVTLKTGVMAAENLALHHRNKLHFMIHENRKQLF